ncbi:plasmid mobilization protein [Parasphingorhabdus sp.]|uniref:plasmid mobilization protein n=1 Tax=Parasphingorhabdus sp. TaxID=2709688 RepID=UPI003D2A318C
MSRSNVQQFNAVSASPTPEKLYPMSFRVTAREKAKIKKYAGDESVSRYLRDMALKGNSKRRSDITIKMDMAARLLGMLGQSELATNLQKIADAAEMGALPVTDELTEELRNACALILAIRIDLIEALGIKAAS